MDGTSWSEPNPDAKLHQISAIDDLGTWGIGDNNRVFKTENRGASWSEPNPQGDRRCPPRKGRAARRPAERPSRGRQFQAICGPAGSFRGEKSRSPLSCWFPQPGLKPGLLEREDITCRGSLYPPRASQAPRLRTARPSEGSGAKKKAEPNRAAPSDR